MLLTAVMKSAKRFWLIFILLPVGLFVFGQLRAANVYDVLVNDDNTGTEQSRPRVAVGYSGEIVVVWADKRSGLGQIYLQYFDSTGTPIGLNRRISGDATSAPQFEPSLNANLLGQFAAVWKDYRNGAYPFNPDIYYTRLSDYGPGTNISVTGPRADSTCQSPDVAVLPNGDLVVVWADYRNGNWDIYGQRLQPDGTAVGANFKINSGVGVNQQHAPRVAGLSDGGFVAVWYDNQSGDDDIYGQRYASTGTTLGGNFKINDDNTTKRQVSPVVAADGNGRFFVAWVDYRNGVYPANPDIYLRRYDAAGSPLGASVKINPSSDETPQKEVSLCSDRMGNLGVVWADSSSGQWDAMARIIENDGTMVAGTFLVHQNNIGRQLQPDVATDGYKFFFAWADSRSGDFDIYLTIRAYNNPTILASPGSFQFNMERDGQLPPSQTLALANAGYGELRWEARSGAEWLTLTPSSGLTPAQVAVTVNTDTLDYGRYVGEIRLIDLDHDDSTEVVSVVLNVTAPIMAISPDTLYFRALAEVGNPSPQAFQVVNSGTGNLNYELETGETWVVTNKINGTAPDLVYISPEIASLMYGNHTAPVIFSSPESIISAETVWVKLELAGNMPYIDIQPDTLRLFGNIGESLSGKAVAANLGSGTLSWQALAGEEWMDIWPTSGVDFDSLTITVLAEGLTSGFYRGEVVVYDSASFNIEDRLMVEVSLSSGDTIAFLTGNVMPSGIGVIPLSLTITQAIKGGYVPFDWEDSLATLDSIVIDPGQMPDFVDYFSHAGAGKGEIGFRISSPYANDSLISADDYILANLFFTAGAGEAFVHIDTATWDSTSAYILDQNFAKAVPYIIPGQLIIGNPTDVVDESENPLPLGLSLGPVFPNPFNAGTNISFSMPEGGEIKMAVYNILGQQIRTILKGHLPAGRNVIRWDGALDNGRVAPSGVYFCLLESKNESRVAKMVLLK